MSKTPPKAKTSQCTCGTCLVHPLTPEMAKILQLLEQIKPEDLHQTHLSEPLPALPKIEKIDIKYVDPESRVDEAVCKINELIDHITRIEEKL